MPQIEPPPNIKIRDNPSEDSVWRRWLTTLSKSYGSLSHNELSGLQGGTTDEYYHLTATEYADLGTVLKIVYADESLSIATNVQVTGHESLTFTGTGDLTIDGTGSLRII